MHQSRAKLGMIQTDMYNGTSSFKKISINGGEPEMGDIATVGGNFITTNGNFITNEGSVRTKDIIASGTIIADNIIANSVTAIETLIVSEKHITSSNSDIIAHSGDVIATGTDFGGAMYATTHIVAGTDINAMAGDIIAKKGKLIAGSGIRSKAGDIVAMSGDIIAKKNNNTGGTISADGDLNASGNCSISGGTIIGGDLVVGGNITTDCVIVVKQDIITEKGNVTTKNGNIVTENGGIIVNNGDIRTTHSIHADKHIVSTHGDFIALDGNMQAYKDIYTTNGNIVAESGDVYTNNIYANADIATNGGNVLIKKNNDGCGGDLIVDGIVNATKIIATSDVLIESGNLSLGSGNITTNGNLEANTIFADTIHVTTLVTNKTIETTASSLSSNTHVTAANNIISQNGNIKTSKGDIIAQSIGNSGGNVIASKSVIVGGSVIANDSVKTNESVIAQKDINVGNNVTVGQNIEVVEGDINVTTGNIYSQTDIVSKVGNIKTNNGDIISGCDIVAKSEIISKNGNITTKNGDIISGDNIIAKAHIVSKSGNVMTISGDIISGAEIIATTGITAKNGNIVAVDGNIISGGELISRSNIVSTTGSISTVENDIISGLDLIANSDIKSLTGNISALVGKISAPQVVVTKNISVGGAECECDGDISVQDGIDGSGANINALSSNAGANLKLIDVSGNGANIYTSGGKKGGNIVLSDKADGANIYTMNGIGGGNIFLNNSSNLKTVGGSGDIITQDLFNGTGANITALASGTSASSGGGANLSLCDNVGNGGNIQASCTKPGGGNLFLNGTNWVNPGDCGDIVTQDIKNGTGANLSLYAGGTGNNAGTGANITAYSTTPAGGNISASGSINANSFGLNVMGNLIKSISVDGTNDSFIINSVCQYSFMVVVTNISSSTNSVITNTGSGSLNEKYILAPGKTIGLMQNDMNVWNIVFVK